MASVQTPVRQPFGVLDGSKLRNLQSIKNRQNAIAPSSAPSLKRRHIALDLSDSENVDPVDFKASSSKRKKIDTEDNLHKPSSLTLKTFSQPQPRISSSSILTSRLETPTINTAIKPTITSSAPAAAGRSPTRSKRSGILSNRRTRLNTPAFGRRSTASLSLAAAVNGTLASKKHKQRSNAVTLEESKPKSWFFDIYEETEQQQDFMVSEWTMTQSACTLDISDDESKTATREERGKENIPPIELNPVVTTAPATAATTEVPTSRKDMMTDEPRTPLGDLNPSEYFAEGCDATSVVLVAEDPADPANPANPVPSHAAETGILINHTPSVDFNFNAEITTSAEEHDDKLMAKSELSDLLLSVSSTLPIEHHHGVEAGLFEKCNGGRDGENAGPANIEIWESGSAKDEAGETGDAEMGMGMCESIFAEL